MKKYFFFFYCTLALVFISQTSCKKLKGFSKGNLSFSADTVVFDTVFTTIGSTTKQFKIYNPDNKTVTIDQLELVGGSSSPFRINVDGQSGTSFTSIRLEGGDSLYIFVEVTLQVNNQSNPMVIEDAIRFRTNGSDQFVQLAVWGQDMYYHYSSLVPGKEVFDKNDGTWLNDKPHLIYGAAFVDEDKTLTIPAGTNIYLHKNALLYVYKGTLNIEGTLNNEVIFQGDRLEADYDDVSGQYYGIYFDSAKASSINYAIIKNGTTGIHLFADHESNFANEYTLTISNTQIYNHANNGMLIYSGARVKADNCVIHHNEAFGVLVLLGGGFNFNHSTILGYNSQSKNQAFGVANHFNINGVTNVGSITEGTLTNCVVYGDQATEIAFDTIGNLSGVTLQFDIQRCHLKKEIEENNAIFTNSNSWNSDPQFEDISKNKFTFPSSSPLFGKADPLFPSLTGLTIKGEIISPPNIGAY